MPLEAPNLDDRTFEQLLNDLRLRIPRYTDEWTDFNDSDPGMTMLQLFAWLGEFMLYRMNQIPELNYIKFLQLLGQELKAAQPAEAHLTFMPRPGTDFQPIRKRTKISAQPTDGGDLLVFETTEGLSLIAAPLVSVQIFDGARFEIVTDKNDNPDLSYPPFGWQPQVGSALYLGFDGSGLAANQRPFPSEMRFRVFLPPGTESGQAVRCRDVVKPPAPPVKLVWEYKPKKASLVWERLDHEDKTAAFTQEGYFRVNGPSTIEPMLVGKENQTEYLWIRCRMESGVYPAGREPAIDLIKSNTVPAENLSTERREIVGVSEGVPDQTFEIERTPVQPDSLQLVIEISGQDPEPWQRVDDFLASGPRDQHYRLNATSGEIYFGDGRNGRIPVAGAEIIAEEYRWGGGVAGNVPRGAINAPLTGLIGVESVMNERPASGGAGEQSVDDLRKWAPYILRRRDRAITTDDFESLAREVGGVAKAKAIAAAHPDYAGVSVPGAVTVVIVPDNDEMQPCPSEELKRAVCRYLDERRPVTSELYVKGPTYQKVQVEAKVLAERSFSPDTVRRDVIKALNARLSPLGPRKTAANGQNGAAPGVAGGRANENGQKGWSFGEDLFPTSLYNDILDVEGVLAVTYLAIQVDGLPRDISKPVEVPADGLIYGTGHEVNVVSEQVG